MLFNHLVPLITLAVVVLMTGCSAEKAASPTEKHLTKDQKADLFVTIEGMSAVQTAFPPFGASNHPASSKPSMQKLASEISNRCDLNTERYATQNELRSLKASGLSCPVEMNYDMAIAESAKQETRNIVWKYEVIDPRMLEAIAEDLHSMRKVHLIAEQTATPAAEGTSEVYSFKIQGDFHSPRVNSGTLHLTGQTTLAGSGADLSSKTSIVAHFGFPSFLAKVTIEQTVQKGEISTEAEINGEKLTKEKADELIRRLPQIGLIIDPKA